MAEAVSSQPTNSYQNGRWSLPAEILAALPTDGFLQLELAHKICCHAYTQQVSRLESEAQHMHSTLTQNQHVIKSLERRVAAMETEMQEHQQTARQSLTEQHKLIAEKNALIETVKRLNREVAKLEHFKRNLLQQLQDDAENDGSSLAPSLAAVDLTTERLVTEQHNINSILGPGAARFASPPPAARAAAGRGVVGSAGGAGSVAGLAAAAGSYTSEGGGARTSPRVDGKEFFRQARARLSYEQFSQFLVAIKELNAGRASRENTLTAARGLFGSHNDDLYGLFESLIMRHLTST
eukprot:gene11708-11853_t